MTNGAIVGTFQVANPANTAPANISYRVELFDQYNRIQKWSGVQFTGTSFNFDNYVPSANLPLGTSTNFATVGNLTVTGSCTGCGGGGGGGGYSTIENAGSALAQRATANFLSGIICADNAGQARTDCQIDQSFSPMWTGSHTFNGTTNIAGTFQILGSAPAGKIPIGNGSTFVPGDPLVQGLNAEGSTATNNPVNIGGFDTAGTPAIHGAKVLNANPAGTEYGIVTRPIPSGTQTVSGTITANAGSGTFATSSSQLPAALDGSGYLKVHEQGTATVSGTVTANQGGTWTVQPGNTANTTPWLATINQAGNSATVTASNALKVDGSAVTQPISGTVTANAGSGTFAVSESTLDGAIASSVLQANVKQIGGTAVVADPCQANTKTYVSINQTAKTRLITGTASKKIYVCSLNLVTATAQNIAVIEGTGTTCGTGAAGVQGFGGSAAATGWNLAANSGLAYGGGGFAIGAEGTAADDLCLDQSGTGQVSGGLSYVVQ
ncbi:MAG: hypothetical protein JOZ10_18665 [Acidobacteria bacterium]|nr:hypothetical protein [Acidobacteriota bacterium]MBV9144823.1 hypothetical protein [Acidobacteriota bacterium]MBV9436033.1 hypothetical protein [Acidobacteriota bacterium]